MKSISDILSIIAKALAESLRLGTILFLVTSLIIILIHYRLTPLQHLEQPWVSIVWCGFLLGLSIILYEGWSLALKTTKKTVKKSREKRKRKNLGLIQLNENNETFIRTLVYLKTKETRIFSAPTGNSTLNEMVYSCLLDYENEHEFNNFITYYVVPQYIWERIEPIDVRRLPSSPPWTPGPNSWMRN